MKCDAAVAEKETAEEVSGEKFEYQAEVRSSSKKFRFLFLGTSQFGESWIS